ncbi:glucose/galactose MFS transporter [Thalassomonas viridans]|uniref:Glucose/galactose MFS transporter n=1 Tax=Thalassomonas viridans TaxID=137584 RepID=A0AAE9Z741_9GAMM|nr:glucose/galactose MFS transporter [Thalassomonas viridans]WDE07219.1 glucose/galactose MFS transporter [Thalassomonas viridans]
MEITLTNERTSGNWVPLLIIAALFFVFGFVTWQNGALIPYLQMVCQLTETQALFVAFAFYFAYTAMALPSAWVLERTGYKNGMALGLLLLVAGFLFYIPAAINQAFSLFILAQFIIGSGMTLLQTAANPYVVKVGPVESAAVRIMFMGLMNKGAGVIAPLAFTALVLGDFAGISALSLEQMPAAEKADTIERLSAGLIYPYLGMAAIFVVLAALLKKSPLPELSFEADQALNDGQGEEDSKSSVLQYPALVLGALTLFVYVGAEVIAGDTIGLFASNLGVANATSLTSYTMAFMLIGYALGIAVIPRFIQQETALVASAISGLAFSLCVVLSDPGSSGVSEVLWGWTGIATLPDTITFIALLGFANALVWPAVWPLALKGLGQLTAKGSALLIMGISGGAILPLVYGVLSEGLGGQSAYWMMIPIYLFILFYAVKGHKMTRWS